MTIDTMESSRIIVKNLPKTITEDKFHKHFSQKGEVTDVKLKYNSNNEFRGFGFVGYRTAEQAIEAKDYFDRTFVGACQIKVELCTSLSEKPKPANRKFREKEKAEKIKEKSAREDEAKPAKRKRKEDEILEKCEQDPSFMEFLQAHKKTAASWGNDTLVDELMKMKQKDKTKKDDTEDEKEQIITDKDDTKTSDTEEDGDATPSSKTKRKKKPDVEFHTLKLRDVPKKAKKKDIKSFFAPLKLKSIRFPRGVRGIVFVGFGSEADRLKGLQRNRSVLLGNKIKMRIYNTTMEAEGADETPKGRWQQLQEELEKVAEPVAESGRIFIRNLPYTTNEDEITKVFAEFGPITELHLPIDKITRRLKGFGFVSFMLPEHADKAFKALDGTIFQGRMLHLLPAKSHEDLESSELNAGSSFKTEKEQKLKKSAGSSHNWNALFLGSSAVSKVISEKYGISREEMLLDKNDEQDSRLASVGVRMALAETEIVSETKKFLEDNGVCLDAFDSKDKKPERSKTVMLAKNLPAGTTADDLKELFVKHGVLNRIILPPSGITGIVEFAEPAEARAAFKKLAYSKFFDVPLYLEWAPIGVFSRPADKKEASKLISDIKTEVKPEQQTESDPVAKILAQDEDYEPVDENAVPELDTTLFVKNLNFRTQEAPLRKHFVQCGPVYAATVARKKDPDNPDVLLSMGYGFVQYYRKKDAEKALSTLNGTMLENHILELKRSSRTLVKENSDAAKKQANSTKILVRNIPFSATQEEVTDLFKTFGKLKAVRLPKKLTGANEHRGFAFIEYHSDSDAKKAYDTLCKSTHLYGRRLVLEWAAQDETIEDLRAKTARLASASASEADSSLGGSTKKKLQRYFESRAAAASKSNDNEEEDDDEQND